MTIHHQDDTVTVHHGDALHVLAQLPDASIDAVVTDPPYGLEFMGREWDGRAGFTASLDAHGAPVVLGQIATGRDTTRGPLAQGGTHSQGYAKHNPAVFQQWCERWTAECLRVLKPGGHLLAFGGTRTWHRLACAVEDAGFEVRDSIAWLYGSGFPKSLDVSKAIDKAAGAEREVLATGTPVRRLIPGADQNRTGTWIKDNGREFVPTDTAPATDAARQWQGWGTALKPSHEPIVVARKTLAGTVAANVQAHGTGALNIDATRVGTTVETWPKSRASPVDSRDMHHNYVNGGTRTEATGDVPPGRWPANVVMDGDQADALDQQSGNRPGFTTQRDLTARPGRGTLYRGGMDGLQPGIREGFNDSGGASRFFPVFRYQAKAPRSERPTVDGVAHPTVKPLALMRWLCRLVTPPGGTVLEPFAGSGTTIEAALLEGFRVVAVEREADYLPLIDARIARAREQTTAAAPPDLFDLFDDEDGGAA